MFIFINRKYLNDNQLQPKEVLLCYRIQQDIEHAKRVAEIISWIWRDVFGPQNVDTVRYGSYICVPYSFEFCIQEDFNFLCGCALSVSLQGLIFFLPSNGPPYSSFFLLLFFHAWVTMIGHHFLLFTRHMPNAFLEIYPFKV